MGKFDKGIDTGQKKPRVMAIDIDISEFKARCTELLEEVRLKGARIRISQLGQTFAEIVPVCRVQDRASWIASMKDTCEITGDIVSPA
jgi:antitoxin (DNA-binding transcriptional repressor) of toxin-antitoxin stability system